MTTEGANQLGPKGLAFLEGRGLDPELATVKLGVHTGRFSGGEVVASGAAGADILIYPVLGRDGVRLYDKYRKLSEKKFWREKGTEEIPAVFYGAEVFADEGLYRERDALPLVIVEGYEDRLVGMMAGFPATVSVPDGAPPPRPKKRDKDERLDDHEDAKFSFMANAEADLARVRWFIIAVDDDAPGRALRDEIVHRVGAARCAVVEYPKGCKDLSDVLRDHGLAEVERILKAAKPHPVKGLYKLADYPDKPPVQIFSSGIAPLDKHFQIFPGAFVVVTGIPSMGKSTLVGNLLVNYAEMHEWSAAMISPEMPVAPHLRDKFRRQIMRCALSKFGKAVAKPEQIEYADKFINRYFTFIEPDPLDAEEDELSLEWVLEKAGEALLRYGIRVLVIDPWNELEHAIERGEPEERYTNRSLRNLRRWAVARGVAVIVLAHPTKDVGKDGKARRPTPYDIAGSAHWYNKPDAVLVVHRPDEDKHVSEVRIAKVRHQETGAKGVITLDFNLDAQRYSGMTNDSEILV